MSSKKEIVLQLKNLETAKDIKKKKINLSMDVYLLDSILAFIYKDSVLRKKKTLSNFAKVFDMTNDAFYEDKPHLAARIWIIRKTLHFILQEKVEDMGVIKSSLLDDPECQGLKITLIEGLDDKVIGYEESKKLIRMMDDRLQFGYILTVKQIYQEILDYIDENDYKTYKEVSDIMYQVSNAVIQLRRNANSLDSDSTFSLEDDKFEACVTDAVTRLQDKMKVLKTGITRLNTILAPGYLSKRLYMYLAFPGGGKSQILLKSALDIKKYNHVIPKNPDNHPCVLYITMENSVEETIERIFNMCVSSDDIRNYTPKQVIRKLREGGHLKLTDDDNINIIIKYYPNKSISTDDLYGIINDLEDEGNEVISLVLDYVKRIRSAERAKDEKEELKNVTNELKNLASYFDISVITAQQLNRSSASVIDSAMQAKKEDLAKLIGRDAVGSAWEIIENSDWVCILHQEVKVDTNQLFMTFKLIKRRYRSTEEDENLRRLEYFNHPYEPGNDVKLMDDINLDKPLSVALLGSDLDVREQDKRGQKNAMNRESKSKEYSNTGNKGESEFDMLDDELEFQQFDSKKSSYI